MDFEVWIIAPSLL